MLTELVIRDLALIERATLAAGAGLNVISGETGAGKSLLLDALELLLGERARSSMVRAGASEARIEGRFLLADDAYGAEVARWLAAELPEALEEGRQGSGEVELILSRSLQRDGRSRAHVNHRPVTSRILRELAALLVEIHGQNDHQRLLAREVQLQLLDAFAGSSDTLAGYRERRARWLELTEQLARFDASEAERETRLDLLRFQSQELASFAPRAGEREELESERELLRHADGLTRSLGGALRGLAEDEGSALERVESARRLVEDWSRRLPKLADCASALASAGAELEEAARSLQSLLDGIESDPARLEAVEERLAEWARLERRHRTDAAGLVQRAADLAAEIEALESAAVGREELARSLTEAEAALSESARRLGRERRAATERLSALVHESLSELGLERARFSVDFGEPASADAPLAQRYGPDGAERVEFFLAANPGEPPAPLRQVASGGEVARIMLALRSALTVRQSTPTLVFDEVDAGVGGRLGPKLGAHLRALARHHQILCVTHLPAIAAAAHLHTRVHKETDGTRTRTIVSELAGEARIQEIADMIAGGGTQETALAEARRLLGVEPAAERPKSSGRAKRSK